MADLTWGPSSEAPVGGEVAAAAPGARLPAAAPPSAAEPRGSEGGGATAAGLTDDEAIRVVLGGYRAAYEKLDVAAARSVWPTVDAAALARAFGGLRSQGIRFQECKVDVNGARAHAHCTGWSTFVPRVGSRNPQSLWLEWRFTLQRGGEGWTIADVSTR